MSTPIIRTIQKKDNSQIASVIRGVLIEHNVPKVGTAYEDVSLDVMYETYKLNRTCYFVVELDGEVLGGAGIAPLENYKDDTICELQKMYFHSKLRGRGIGQKLIQICLAEAKKMNFEHCYLETMPYMKAAQKLYAKSGFKKLEGPMGDTGHYACSVHMLKKLS